MTKLITLITLMMMFFGAIYIIVTGSEISIFPEPKATTSPESDKSQGIDSVEATTASKKAEEEKLTKEAESQKATQEAGEKKATKEENDRISTKEAEDRAVIIITNNMEATKVADALIATKGAEDRVATTENNHLEATRTADTLKATQESEVRAATMEAYYLEATKAVNEINATLETDILTAAEIVAKTENAAYSAIIVIIGLAVVGFLALVAAISYTLIKMASKYEARADTVDRKTIEPTANNPAPTQPISTTETSVRTTTTKPTQTPSYTSGKPQPSRRHGHKVERLPAIDIPLQPRRRPLLPQEPPLEFPRKPKETPVTADAQDKGLPWAG